MSAYTNKHVCRPSLQPAPAAIGARIVFVTAAVVKWALFATRQVDVPSVLTVSRAETVRVTSMSAKTTHVTNTPTAPTQSVLSSVSARPDTHSTTQPSVKVCPLVSATTIDMVRNTILGRACIHMVWKCLRQVASATRHRQMCQQRRLPLPKA